MTAAVLSPVTAPDTVPTEVTTPIKFSQALRLGRLTHPRPLRGMFYDGADGACALGAIILGLGVLLATLPYIAAGPCPVCGWSHGAGGMTLHLNDDHHWSDDQIVTFLESIGL